MSDKAPYILNAQDGSTGRPATFIFMHGYSDEAEGLPLGLAQQFHWYNKMQYLKWVLPNAPIDRSAGLRSWYTPKALPNAQKPRVPGHEEDDPDEPDDEEGILKTCGLVDELVEAELDAGVEPGRIFVGGFSQGCAVSLVWGLVGKQRNNVGGMFCVAGYFPLGERIGEIRKERGIEEGKQNEEKKKKWLYIHGSRDALVPGRFFERGKTELKKWIEEKDLQERMYVGMAHAIDTMCLKDLLIWLTKIAPP